MMAGTIMNRRNVLLGLIGLFGGAFLGTRRRNVAQAASSGSVEKFELPRNEWKKRLQHDAYAVMFEEATERARSSPLDQEKRAGTFVCAACALPLFESSAKFESGTGWPSFFQPIEGHVATKRDCRERSITAHAAGDIRATCSRTGRSPRGFATATMESRCALCRKASRCPRWFAHEGVGRGVCAAVLGFVRSIRGTGHGDLRGGVASDAWNLPSSPYRDSACPVPSADTSSYVG